MNNSHLSTEFAVSDLNICENIYMDDILALDFELEKLRLKIKFGTKKWPNEKCERVELKYKRFLALKRCFPHLQLVPCAEIDYFWLEHYADEEKYAKETTRIFGYVLNQFQFFGLSRREAGIELKQSLQETKNLYHRFFNENYFSFNRLT